MLMPINEYARSAPSADKYLTLAGSCFARQHTQLHCGLDDQVKGTRTMVLCSSWQTCKCCQNMLQHTHFLKSTSAPAWVGSCSDFVCDRLRTLSATLEGSLDRTVLGTREASAEAT